MNRYIFTTRAVLSDYNQIKRPHIWRGLSSAFIYFFVRGRKKQISDFYRKSAKVNDIGAEQLQINLYDLVGKFFPKNEDEVSADEMFYIMYGDITYIDEALLNERRILIKMNYENTNLPEDVRKYLEEIYNDDELREVFCDCDIEINDEEWLRTVEEEGWLEDLIRPGESSYSDLKPFGRDGSGALWVVIDDKMIGYIGTEGQCGIVARNIHEFMNIVSAWGGYLSDYWDEDILASEKVFYSTMNSPERLGGYDNIERNQKVFEGFIKRHGFTKEIYEMAVGGITAEPFFIIKATTDEYVDFDSLISPLDGQNKLEDLIKKIRRNRE